MENSDIKSIQHLLTEIELLKTKVAALDVTDSTTKRAEEKFHPSLLQSLAWLEISPVCTKMVDLDFNPAIHESFRSKSTKS